MNATVVLEQVDHRPWPPPTRPWVLRQRLEDLLFAHWPTPADQLRALLPRGVDLDVFDGTAWISIVAFRATRLRLHWVPPFPLLSSYLQLNVRTYVRVRDEPGVYFFSVDAGSRPSVALARRWFHLPCSFARMSIELRGETIHYASRRRQAGRPAAELVARYQAAGPELRAEPGTLEHWLTERYRFYGVDRAGAIHQGEIHHVPWPLQPASAAIDHNTMAPPGISLSSTPAILRSVRALDLLAWAPARVA